VENAHEKKNKTKNNVRVVSVWAMMFDQNKVLCITSCIQITINWRRATISLLIHICPPSPNGMDYDFLFPPGVVRLKYDGVGALNNKWEHLEIHFVSGLLVL